MTDDLQVIVQQRVLHACAACGQDFEFPVTFDATIQLQHAWCCRKCKDTAGTAHDANCELPSS